MEIVNHHFQRGVRGYTLSGGPNSGAILVKRDQDSWKPVDRVERAVGDLELSNSYGLWKDKEKTRGALFWKETVRPADNEIQTDEVTTFRDAKDHALMRCQGDQDPSYLTRDRFRLDLRQTKQGTLVVLEERWRER